MRQSGFTLIEVVVVLGVLALVTALVLPMMTGTQAKADIQSSARDLAAALRVTRNLAMTHGRAEALVVDTASGAFRAGASAAPRRVAGGVKLALLTATQELIDEHTGAIRFFADGSSSGGGIRLSKGNLRDQVLVDWLTGRVSIGDGVNAAR